MRRILVVVAVVGLALMLFLWRREAEGEGPVVESSQDVAQCCANLREIYEAILVYHTNPGDPPAPMESTPKESGVRFLGALLANSALQGTPENPAYFTCPGPNATPVPNGVDYRALDKLTGADSAYAARDNITYPLPKFPLGGSEIEPLVACDNAHGLNHEGCMNVLYSDGSVKTLFLTQEIERGHLPPGSTNIPVGKDSPIPDLRKLSQD